MSGCWSSEERTSPDGTIASVQRVVLARAVVPPSAEGARELGSCYWAEVERGSRGLLRVRHDDSAVSLVLAGMVPLLRFGAAQLRVDGTGVECRFPIVDGLLVARPGGSLAVVQRAGDVSELELAVTGYHPRLVPEGPGSVRRFLYSSVQRPLHLALSRRFLLGAVRRCS